MFFTGKETFMVEKKLFIVAAEAIVMEKEGPEVELFPLGVEIAPTLMEAQIHAADRWPYHVRRTAEWAKVSPDVRLAAIEADRQM